MWDYPGPGVEIKIPLISVDRRELFLLDIRRHAIQLVHGGKYQVRARNVSPIARICFARPHRNPDGEEIPPTHLHVFREGHELQWAYALNPAEFPNADNRWRLLVDFMRYASISREPLFQQDAFA